MKTHQFLLTSCVFAMATVCVSVFNAITGDELLAKREMHNANCIKNILTALGDRPSIPVILFQNGQKLNDDFTPPRGAMLQLSAAYSQGSIKNAFRKSIVVGHFRCSLCRISVFITFVCRLFFLLSTLAS